MTWARNYLTTLVWLAGSAASVLAATKTWNGSLSSDWALSGNWQEGSIPTNGDDLVFTQGAPACQPSNNTITGLSLKSIRFANASFTSALTLGGEAFTLDASYGAAATLTNGNTTAGREVTILNAITVSGDQRWAANTDIDAIVIIAGNLSGSGKITIAPAYNSNGAGLPPFRLAGSNSGYSGTITTPASDSYGILLTAPAAMPGGLIDLNNGNRNLWLTGNSPATPYTFQTGNAGGSPNVDFRGSGDGGLYLTGGDAYWDPGNGGSYTWLAGSASNIRLQGALEALPPRMYYFGNTSGNLVLGGDRKIVGNSKGFNGGRLTVLYALADDATGGRTFTAASDLLILTRPAVNTGATPSKTSVILGSLAVSNMNQLYSGNLLINGGSFLFNGMPWSDFTATRPSYGPGSSQWQVGATYGFAAHGSSVTVDLAGITSTNFDRSLSLGSPVLDSDGSPYANAPVLLTRSDGLDMIPLPASADRTVSIYGPAVTTGSGFYDIPPSHPVHEIAGRITGGGAGRKLVINGGQKAAYGLVRLSNTGNTFQAAVSMTDNNSPFGVLIASDDRAFGNPGNGVVLRGDQGGAGATGWLLLFENRDGGDKGFGRAVTVTNASTYGPLRQYGLGAYAGHVVYTGALTSIGNTNALGLFHTINLHVEPRAQLRLGAADAAANLVESRFSSALAYTTVYRKIAPGTLVLKNVAYADSGPNTHAFQIGRGGGGVTNYDLPCWFDGAVQETGGGTSNSLAGQNITLAAGVLETCDANLGGPFARSVGPGANQVQWAPNSGGGFSAHGGPLTVNLYGLTPATSLYYNTTAFAPRKQALMFGSLTADNVVTWLNPVNLSGSSADAAEIRVIDNPATNTDRAVIAGNIGGGVGGTSAFLYKGGDGILEFAPGMHCAPTGMLMVCAGALVVNGSIDKLATYNVYVTNNAILAGNGRIDRNVIAIGGALAPGDVAPSNVVGILTVTNLTMTGASSLNLDLGVPGSSDKLAVLGPLTLAGTINVTNVTGFAAGNYEIATYIGALTNTAVVGAMPAHYSAAIDTNTPGKVILAVSGSGVRPGGTIVILR